MKTIIKFVGTGLKWGTFLSTLGFIAVILLQIFARLFLATAPSWTEEAARVFFVLAIGFSAGPALRSGEYVHFDFFYRRMPTRGQRRLLLFVDGLTVALFAVFTFFAVHFTVMGWRETSPSLGFPMAIPFAGMVVLGGSVLVYGVWRLRSGVHTSEAPENRSL